MRDQDPGSWTLSGRACLFDVMHFLLQSRRSLAFCVSTKHLAVAFVLEVVTVIVVVIVVVVVTLGQAREIVAVVVVGEET